MTLARDATHGDLWESAGQILKVAQETNTDLIVIANHGATSWPYREDSELRDCFCLC